VSDLENNNYTIQWFRDHEMISSQSNPDKFTISANPGLNDAGFYCCSVRYNDNPISRHCITVWIGGKSLS